MPRTPEKNRRECLEDKRPSKLFVGRVERPNDLFGDNGKRPTALFGGVNKRSSALFVGQEERPNALAKGERNHCCDVKNGRTEQLQHQDKGARPMALF